MIAVPDPRRKDWPAQDSGFKIIFGLGPKAKWPDDGMTRIGVTTSDLLVTYLWVLSKTEAARQGVPRLMARCPKCGKDFGGGKIQQHYRSHR
jgi:hypothetical protein